MKKIILALSLLTNLYSAESIECEKFENELECDLKSKYGNQVSRYVSQDGMNGKFITNIVRLNIEKNTDNIEIRLNERFKEIKQLDINIDNMTKKTIILFNGMRIRIKVKGAKNESN